MDKNILQSSKLQGTIPKESFGVILYNSLNNQRSSHIKEPKNISFENVEFNAEISRINLLEKSIKVANLIQNSHIKCNVAIYCENHTDFFIPVIGCLFLGYPIVSISHTYSKYELVNVLNLTKPNIVFCSKATVANIRAARTENAIEFVKEIIVLEEINYEDIEVISVFKPKELSGDSVAAMMFSSGTTGLPKAVMITHQNLNYFLHLFRDENLPLSKLNNHLMIVPFTHVYGLVTSLVSIILERSVKFMVKFNPELFLEKIQEHQIECLPLVPPLMAFLTKFPKLMNYDLSSIKTIFCGGAPLRQEIQEKLKQKLPNVTIIQAYGMTELTLIIACTPNNTKENFKSVGKLLPGHQLKVRDIKTHEILGANKIGEILIAGPSVTAGYYQVNNDFQKENESTFLQNNWIATGDLGYFDEDGYIYIVDRIKELIKYNGFQVAPAELEELLLMHCNIQDAMVVGLRNEDNGELPVAFVVKKPGSNLAEMDVQNYVKKLVSYPKYLRGGVHFVDSIPKTPSGKLLRRELRDYINKN